MSSQIPENDGEALITALSPLYRLVMSSANLKSTGLTKTQIIILSSLTVKGQLMMSQIADYISSLKSQATRAVTSLEELGYITRYTDTTNRTKVYVKLTEAGEAFIAQWQVDTRNSLNEKLKEQISDEDRDKLYHAAFKLTEILGKII